MESLTISAELALGILLGIIIPLVLWGIKMYSMTKQNLDMHLDPEEYGFGTTKTNQLLAEHNEQETMTHIEAIQTTRSLNMAINELTHYIKWLGEHSIGKNPPPPLRGAGSSNKG